MAKNTKNSEETVTTTELAPVAPAAALAVPADDFGFGEFAGDEDRRTKDELVLERVRIVQGTTKDRAKHGLKERQIFFGMSKKGFDKLLIVPVFDYRTIVERSDDKKGTFIKEHLETQDGSGDFGDLKVQKSIAAVGGDVTKIRKSVPDANGVVTQLALTYNCLIATLDPEDGVTVTGFGLLQADKTNIRPYNQWRQDRVAFKGAVSFPTYAFRAWVDGSAEYTNPEGQTTKQYKFTPYVNNNWKDSCFNPKNPEHLEVLRGLKEQRELMKTGAIKVADHSSEDGGVSEDQAEDAAF
jgi:hypothetical protein